MLWVYAGLDILRTMELAKQDAPDALDLSKLTPDELASAVHDYCNHCVTGHIYIGYLDPLLMLHPTDETLLRRGFTQCTMSVVVSNPNLLPLAWKNGTAKLKCIGDTNVTDTKALDDGGTPHVRNEVEYGRTPAQTAVKRVSHKGRKAGSSAPGRKQAGQD
jgi:hypothetical protein